MISFIKGLECYTPVGVLTNEQIAGQHKGWSERDIEKKVGIVRRCIALEGESASDLACKAAEKLFSSGLCMSHDIDYLLFCTQSPDYILPTTACIIQNRLDIPTSAGALDFNLGCSGYVYGLGLAKGLIESYQACNILLLTADTYSKYIDPDNKAVKVLFGDAASATLVSFIDVTTERSRKEKTEGLGPFVYGTDGTGFDKLIIARGGSRSLGLNDDRLSQVTNVNKVGLETIQMNGPEIFAFSLKRVPQVVAQVLCKAQMTLTQVDLFIFHQANKYMLEHLRKKIGIPEKKFYISIEKTGNTVSSSIPLALKNAQRSGMLFDGQRIMLVGYGVGYSWGATVITWRC